MSLFVLIDYTNWRGERSKRVIQPIRMFEGSSEWHPTTQHLLEALDCGKGMILTFAMSGIHSWATCGQTFLDAQAALRATTLVREKENG